VDLPPFDTVPGLLAWAADTWGDATALEDGEVALSFRALHDAARRVAGALARRGLAPGDAVALWAPNGWRWVVAAHGASLAGGVIVPINTRYKADEARWILERSRARRLLVAGPFLGLDLRAILGPTDVPTDVLDDVLPTWLAEAPAGELPRVGPDDPSDVIFTSGTTGRAKGVVATHAQTTRTFWIWSDVVGLRAGDRYLVVAPFFHTFGFKAGWLACLMRGATVLPQAVFDADAVLHRLAHDRVSVLPGPPALYASLLRKDLSGVDRSTLRLAVTGAAVVPVQLVRDLHDVLGFETVLTAYGLTESTGVVTMCRRGDDVETVATTSGRPIPGVEVRVVDADDRDVPDGTPGHVLVRGFCVTRGYLDDPGATADAIRDGWLRTGDVGVRDAAGNLRIVDRLKDLILVGGFNVSPAEVEELLRGHPAVADVAVIGVPDDRLGEVGAAYVVPRGALDEAEVIAWCRERMANFKVPRHVVTVDALPRNASGKVVKPALRALAKAG
jgi:acyl-CoA synthetase (AMP-forming)/AMP-acid ligase II